MGKKAGHEVKPPGSGRKAGTRNKRTQSLIKQAEERFPDLNPVLGMMQIAKDTLDDFKNGTVVDHKAMLVACEQANKGDFERYNALTREICSARKLALDALSQAAPYLHAKLKSIDMQIDAKVEAVPVFNLQLTQVEQTVLDHG